MNLMPFRKKSKVYSGVTYSSEELEKLQDYVKDFGWGKKYSEYIVLEKPGKYAFSHVSNPNKTVALFEKTKQGNYRVKSLGDEGKKLLKLNESLKKSKKNNSLK